MGVWKLHAVPGGSGKDIRTLVCIQHYVDKLKDNFISLPKMDKLNENQYLILNEDADKLDKLV